jgi:hypothetical protein
LSDQGDATALRRQCKAFVARFSCAAAFCCACGVAAAGDDSNLLSDRFNVSAGGFVLDTDTTLRFDANGLDRGTEFNWEDEFGEGDITRFRLDAQWRFAERHKLRSMWFSTERDATQQIDQTIRWGNVTFPVGVDVSSRFAFDVFELAYDYTLLRRPDYEIAGSFGVHYTSIEADLEAEFVAPGPGGSVRVRDEADVDAPLPVAGLRTTVHLGRQFWLDATAQYFYLSIDKYSGSIQDFRLSVTWQPRRWMGVGIGYNRFAVDVNVDDDQDSGKLDWMYRGPILFYSASF